MVITGDHLESSVTQELLSRARDGDAQAFCLLVEPLQARLLRQAVALTGDVSAAEDLVSETLVEAWKSLRRFNASCRLSTWLYSILLHRRQKAVRRARSRPISWAWLPFFKAQELHEQQQQVSSVEPSPSEAASQNEAFVQLRHCIQTLPGKHRQIILLRFFEDASLPDMAAVLGCSIGTVKSRLHQQGMANTRAKSNDSQSRTNRVRAGTPSTRQRTIPRNARYPCASLHRNYSTRHHRRQTAEISSL